MFHVNRIRISKKVKLKTIFMIGLFILSIFHNYSDAITCPGTVTDSTSIQTQKDTVVIWL